MTGFWILSSIFARVSWIRAYIVAFDGIAARFGIIASCFIVVVNNDGFELLNIQRGIKKIHTTKKSSISISAPTDFRLYYSMCHYGVCILSKCLSTCYPILTVFMNEHVFVGARVKIKHFPFRRESFVSLITHWPTLDVLVHTRRARSSTHSLTGSFSSLTNGKLISHMTVYTHMMLLLATTLNTMETIFGTI